jgi:hypothetical protein
MKTKDIIKEGEEAFFKKVDELLNIGSLKATDKIFLTRAKEAVQNNEEWNKTFITLYRELTTEVMMMQISPELREIYSKCYKYRESLENIQRNIEGSMTLLMIFD